MRGMQKSKHLHSTAYKCARIEAAGAHQIFYSDAANGSEELKGAAYKKSFLLAQISADRFTHNA